MASIGGRPRLIKEDDIVRVGRELGLRDLSMNAVATRLGVSSTALYRHVEDRWALEQLVGESILAELAIIDDPDSSTVEHLLSMALELRAFVLQHPGLAAYVQTLFPRGDGGRRLLAREVAALGRRGYAPDVAIVLASAVASVAIGFTAAEELRRERTHGLASQQRDALQVILGDAILGSAHESLPSVEPDAYMRLWLGAAIRGFVEAAPPGRSTSDIMAALDAAGRNI